MQKEGIALLAIGIVLLGYGVNLGQHIDTEHIATYICLSCLGLTPSSYQTDTRDTGGIERIDRNIELVTFSAEWCKSCPDAIKIVKEIASSSPSIEYRVIKYEEQPAKFDEYNVDRNGLPVTIVFIDGGEVARFDGVFKLDSKILGAIKNA